MIPVVAIVAKSTFDMNEMFVRPTAAEAPMAAVIEFITRWGNLLNQGQYVITAMGPSGESLLTLVAQVDGKDVCLEA